MATSVAWESSENFTERSTIVLCFNEGKSICYPPPPQKTKSNPGRRNACVLAHMSNLRQEELFRNYCKRKHESKNKNKKQNHTVNVFCQKQKNKNLRENIMVNNMTFTYNPGKISCFRDISQMKF